MANTITTNPLVIDTAATIAFTRPLLAKFIEWVAPTTAGQVCVIADIGGNIIAKGVCAVANTAVTLWPGPIRLTLPGKSGNANGSWQVSTIQAGQLLIWY